MERGELQRKINNLKNKYYKNYIGMSVFFLRKAKKKMTFTQILSVFGIYVMLENVDIDNNKINGFDEQNEKSETGLRYMLASAYNYTELMKSEFLNPRQIGVDKLIFHNNMDSMDIQIDNSFINTLYVDLKNIKNIVYRLNTITFSEYVRFIIQINKVNNKTPKKNIKVIKSIKMDTFEENKMCL